MNINSQPTTTEFNGAALIDEHGREIPITEAMVQQACKTLANSWNYPGTASTKPSLVETKRPVSP